MVAKLTYEEQELIASLRMKDDEAFSYLYEHYSGALYGVIKQIVGDAELSNDVVQEAFVNIWRKMDSYDETKGRLFTWMLNIARMRPLIKPAQKAFSKPSAKYHWTEKQFNPMCGPALMITA